MYETSFTTFWAEFLLFYFTRDSVTLGPGIPGGPDGPARPLIPELGKPGAPATPFCPGPNRTRYDGF